MNLQDLTISRSRVEDDGMVELAKALFPMSNLRELQLHQNFIREKGMVALFEILADKENIEILNLQDNFIVGKGVDGLCKFIQNAKNLRVLNLGDCNIKRDMNELIISALEVWPFLTQPNFLEIGMSDRGIQLLL